MFSGSIVALVTPFKKGKINEKKLKELVRFHCEKGTDGIVPCGTTGELSTLSHAEHKRVIEIVVRETKKKIPVIAGAGSNSTEETIELCRFSKKIGADGVLLVVPYYNKPSQNGLYLHFSRVAQSVSIPIMLYNIPGRTGINMMPSTVVRLAQEHPTIVGIKEATGSMDQTTEIVQKLGEGFDVLSGDDALTLPLLAIGAKGVISVVANIIPEDVKNMITFWNSGDIYNVRRLHVKMFPLIKACFLETNPVPVKTAMRMLNMCSDEVRLPLAPMSDSNKKKLKRTLKEYGLKI